MRSLWALIQHPSTLPQEALLVTVGVKVAVLNLIRDGKNRRGLLTKGKMRVSEMFSQQNIIYYLPSNNIESYFTIKGMGYYRIFALYQAAIIYAAQQINLQENSREYFELKQRIGQPSTTLAQTWQVNEANWIASSIVTG